MSGLRRAVLRPRGRATPTHAPGSNALALLASQIRVCGLAAGQLCCWITRACPTHQASPTPPRSCLARKASSCVSGQARSESHSEETRRSSGTDADPAGDCQRCVQLLTLDRSLHWYGCGCSDACCGSLAKGVRAPITHPPRLVPWPCLPRLRAAAGFCFCPTQQKTSANEGEPALPSV